MLKQMLLIGAAAVSFPVLAQTTAPAADSAAPTTAAEPAPVPESTMPTDPATTPASAPDASAPPAATEPAPAAGTAATPTQIAQIVEKEFPTYDADANGDLNNMEFAAWMKKLRAATEPGVDPESAEVKAWIDQAFAAADGDKSGAVNKTELTGFLSRGA
ncbi:calcium-binding protein [Sphingopyxis sp. L1A2A]|uniref:calcium-binding protein n=1 Tax=Sphingopyxis sp. L1A2A TaxID=2502247 RepID=UPI0010F48BFE|nr:calcium-binding protein [Sphingopyxis sp. L1A2A]